MDDGTIMLLSVNLLTGIALYLLWSGRVNLNMTAEEMHERIDVIEDALKVVGMVLEKIPELVPQFSINQNPFQSIIDALAQRIKENMGQPSITDPLLRDDNGMFTDGPKEENPT